MKRLLDLLLAIFGLMVFSPLLVLTGSLLWLFDGSPVIFRQRRIGRNGEPFTLYKFRTMRNASGGKEITVQGDSRITRMGKILRKTKLDELPQLLNVLKGEMSFVGPRPEVESYVQLYSPEQQKVLTLKPGITDPASLIYFDESEILARQSDPEAYYVEYLMNEKIRINLRYASIANPFRDLSVIAMTVGRIFGLRSKFIASLGQDASQHG